MSEAVMEDLLGTLRALETPFHAATDDELLDHGAAWEAVGRLVDARRIACAAEVERRSAIRPGEDGLAARRGLRDGANLVARATRVSVAEAKRRVVLGSALAPRYSLAQEELPGRYPLLAEAVRDGDVGLDSARLVVTMLHGKRKKVPAADRGAAEAELTESALVLEADLIEVQVALWKARLDQDGPRPSEKQRHRQRSFALGKVDGDGGARFSGYAPSEQLAVLKQMLAARRRNAGMIRFPAGHEDNDGPGPEWRELDGEQRTSTQFDFDSFFGTITAGLRAEAEGFTGSIRSLAEVVVQVRLDDLDDRGGAGWVSGILGRVSVDTVERIGCGGGLRLLVNGSAGETLYFGHPRRRFSAAQRTALAVAAGGCQFPGCTAPPSWCDAHHVRWYHRDDGPTDIDNAVLLCSFHHHLIHADDCRWRIEMQNRVPYLVPRHWTGPPDPAHRMQRHPAETSAGPPVDDPWSRRRRRSRPPDDDGDPWKPSGYPEAV